MIRPYPSLSDVHLCRCITSAWVWVARWQLYHNMCRCIASPWVLLQRGSTIYYYSVSSHHRGAALFWSDRLIYWSYWLVITCDILKNSGGHILTIRPNYYVILVNIHASGKSHGLRYNFRHPLDVTMSATKCILGLTDQLWSAIFDTLQYIAWQIWDQQTSDNYW